MARKKSNLLQSELVNFRGFQESQISILNSISKSLENNLENSIKVGDSLTSIVNQLESMTRSSNNLEGERVRLHTTLRRQETSATENYTKSKLNFLKLEGEAISLLNNKLLDLGNTIAEISNRYSQISNDLISVSGASGDDVRDTRQTMVHDIISGLNKETGTFFNPEKSYEKMLGIANDANIGSLEVIEEITRPILLASESMNINNGEIASLLGKWYTRYNFSSSDMETLLDDIKINTAGNNSTAEATRENLSRLESWLTFSAKGDNDKLLAMSESISRGTSWLESMNVDTSRYTEYLADIASGQAYSNTQLIQVLDKAGLSPDQAQSMFENGSIDKLYEALFSGESKILQRAVGQDIKLISQYSDALGMDLEGMLDAYNASQSENFKGLHEFSPEDPQTMVEAVDDKYLSQFDRANNWLASIAEYTASFQEWLHIGVSDILKALAAGFAISKIGGLSGVRGALGRVGSLATRAGGTALSTVGGGSIAAGGALAGGALAGAALATDGTMGLFDKGASKTEKVLSGIEVAGGVGGTAALIGLGLSNPIGWAALAAGGTALLIKKAVEKSKSLEEEAKNAESKLAEANESLSKENESRLKKVNDIDYPISQDDRYNETTYINSNKTTVDNEGVTSSKYIPTSNDSELEMLREYYQESTIRDNSEIVSSMNEFKEILSEIKDFLAYWREDNIKRDMSRDRSSKLAQNTYQLSHYRLSP